MKTSGKDRTVSYANTETFFEETNGPKSDQMLAANFDRHSTPKPNYVGASNSDNIVTTANKLVTLP